MSLSSLLASARPALAARMSEGVSLPAQYPACILFFSLCDGQSRAQVFRASGTDFASAWQAGVQRCQREVQRRKLEVRWLRVDWVRHIAPTTWRALQDEFSTIKRNYFRHGLAFDAALEHAFLEQELNANAMLYAGSNIAEVRLNPKNFAVYANVRYGKKLRPDFSASTPIWRFATEGFFFSDDAAVNQLPRGEAALLPAPAFDASAWRTPATLESGRRQIPQLQSDDVLALIQSSSGFLASQVKKNGRFIYGHFPCFAREIATYNALRHASSVYAMLEAWELTRDSALLSAIRRALTYLVETLIRRYPQPDGSTLAFNVDVNGENKLGANAVSLLALVKYDELTGDTQYRALMEALAFGIAHMQDGSTGKFVHVLNAEDLSVKEEFRIVYYDGEAAFGLMRLYGLTQDARWLHIVERAFDYFIAAKHWRHHDHWLSYCANELTRYKPEEKYFRFGVQNIAGYLDFILQRETTYPTLLELSMAFEQMLRRIHQLPDMQHVLADLDIKKFHRALHHRAHYLLNGFFWPELAMYFAKPQTVVGSFFIRHHSFRVRIDDIEHYLSGYVAYWKMLQDVPENLEHTEQIVASTPLPDASGPVLAWGGDVNLGRRQHYRTAELGVHNILRIPALREADLRIVNLECVIATQGEQGTRKGEDGPYYYRARPEMLRVLAAADIDMVATANNHSGDYGPDALMEQCEWLDTVGLAHAGSGIDREAAFAPAFRRAGSLNVALFSIDATQHRFAATEDSPGSAYLPLHEPAQWQRELSSRIATARDKAHIVLVAVHWGANLAATPSAAEIAVGHALIEAGADAVLGASAHVLQGIEIYQGRPILYDAGDLLFDSVRATLGKGGVFSLELSPDGVRRVVFVPIGIGFGYSEQLTGQAAREAAQDYATQCADLGTSLQITPEGHAFIDLAPPRRAERALELAPATEWDLKALDVPSPPKSSAYRVDAVPPNARIEPITLGPLKLVGLRVARRELTRRRMLWVESFWTCDAPVAEDVRLDIRGVPVRKTTMAPWGRAMDHDPCDWMVPTSRWQPGVIYRDYYGLRPPYLRNWSNVDLQITVGIVSQQQDVTPVGLPVIVRLAVPGKEVPLLAAPTHDESHRPYAFSSSELSQLLGGYWAYAPKDEVYVDYFVSGAGLVDKPRTCMACMDYETWLRGTGNSGHYKNIFSDTHVSFESRYRKLQLEEKVNCLIVQRPIPEVSHIPQLVVEDSYEALKALAGAAREKMGDNGTVFAVTGAVGKSTTCDLLARCIQPFSNCIAMTNGHNSRTGVTLWTASLGMFDPRFDQANNLPNTCVLEVAGSALWIQSGWVIKAARPNISVITHVELTQYGPNSKTIEDVAYFKSRVCEAMHNEGRVVLYREMPLYEKVLGYVTDFGAKPYSYGVSEDADTRLLAYQFNLPTLTSPHEPLTMTVKADVLGEEVTYQVGAVGKPVALNSLAALTAAKLAGFDIQACSKELDAFKARKNTLDIFVQNNVLVLDCSHNLEMPSILAAFEILQASHFSKHGRRIVVMSRIVNLGEIAPDFHLRMEEPFNNFGFDALFIHNPNHEWDRLLPRLSDRILSGVSIDAKGTIAQFVDYVQEGDSLLILGASRGCDFGQVLPGILQGIETKIATSEIQATERTV